MVGIIVECNMYSNKRVEVLNEIISRHLNTTFRGINVKITMSPLGAYLAIEFAWKNSMGMDMNRPMQMPGTMMY
mgnify:CR=1 FL=1